MAVEVEGDGAVEVGAVDADTGGLQAAENVRLGQAEGIAVSDGDDGEAGRDGIQNFWRGGRGAAVVTYF